MSKKIQNSKKSICNYVIVGIFLAFLYLPVIIFPFVKKMLPADNSENRNLATFPKLENLQDLLDFPTGFDAYWSDNLPFRNTIQQMYTDISFELFGVSTSADVIVGKNNGNWRHTWLFYNSIDDSNPLGDVRGTKQLSRDQQSKILSRIKDNTQQLNGRNIRFFYIIAPNKSSIYKEYLPNDISIVNEKSLTRNLAEFLEENGVDNFIFLDKTLNNERARSDGPLYRLLDTHWNNYGAFIGVRAFLEKAEPSFTAYNGYDVEFVENSDASGDLKSFMNLKIALTDYDAVVKTSGRRSYDECIVSESHIQNQILKTTNKNPYFDETVLLIGDSFRTAMIPWLSGVYKEVIYMHRDAYTPKMLEEYSPDIVILEAVERYVLNALGMSFNYQ